MHYLKSCREEQKLSEEPEKNIGKDHIGERKNLVDVQTGTLTADQKEELHTENGEQKRKWSREAKKKQKQNKKTKRKETQKDNRRERYRC